jgi:hypothetical protein
MGAISVLLVPCVLLVPVSRPLRRLGQFWIASSPTAALRL